MRTLIFMIVGTGLLSACSSVSEKPDVAANYAEEPEPTRRPSRKPHRWRCILCA